MQNIIFGLLITCNNRWVKTVNGGSGGGHYFTVYGVTHEDLTLVIS